MVRGGTRVHSRVAGPSQCLDAGTRPKGSTFPLDPTTVGGRHGPGTIAHGSAQAHRYISHRFNPPFDDPLVAETFNKVCNFTFIVPPGTSFWPTNMFGPLWVGAVLPFTHHRPWCLKPAPLLVEMGRELRGLLESCEADARDLLHKLLKLPRRVAPLSQCLACGVLHVPWGTSNFSDVNHQG